MAEITYSFDAMPKILADIAQRLEVMERKIDALQSVPREDADAWLNLKDLCNYLPNHPAEQTVYGWTSTHFIPYHKKGKSIVFRKSEIDEWLRNDKRKSMGDLEKEAQAFVNSKRKARCV